MVAVEVLYEDNHVVVVNKRPGELVQSSSSGALSGDNAIAASEPGELALEERVKAYIRDKYGKPGEVFLGVVHRIDRPVGGAVLFARTSKALVRLNEQLKRREFQKIYWAIVEREPKFAEGELRHWIVRNGKSNKSIAYETQRPGAKEAILRYRKIASSDRYHLLQVELLTGRHHQIRCQLAHIGCPIRGDLKYGAARSNRDGGISLWARRLHFEHPVQHTPVEVTAPTPPQDKLWTYFSSLF